MTFIDDHSRKVCLYFMKHEYEVFQTFKLKAMIENETRLKIKDSKLTMVVNMYTLSLIIFL